MKIYINKYRYHWISPYTICEKICFWRDIDYDEPWVVKTSNFLMPFCEGLQKFLDIVHPKINYVKIDKWDTWGMDSTLAMIILPMLKQLKATKHGSPFVHDKDVPEELRSKNAEPKEHEWDPDSLHHKRWEWVLDEMIWAFEELNTDWEEQYHSGEVDHIWVDDVNNCKRLEHGPNHTYKVDMKGVKKHQERITRGLTLFGKYFQALWD